MSTVGSLAYAIVANTQQFTSGIVASKQELRTLKEAFLQSQSPVERYSAAIAHLESLATKFPAKAQAVNATIAKMRQEMFDASEAGQRLAKRNELVGNVMGRMGLVMDPVSASFQAFNLAVGMAQTALHAFEKIASAVVEEMGRLDELAKKSRKLGVDASDLVGLRRAAEDIAGVTGETFDTAFSVFTRRVAEAAIDGGGEAAKALERLGLSASKLSSMLPNDQLLAVADAMTKVRNSGERLAIANALLGKTGADLAPMLAAGGAEIRKLADDQVTLSQIDFLKLEDIEEANDQLTRLKSAFGSITSLLASELSPLISDVATDLTDGLDKASNKGEKLREAMQTVAIATAIATDNFEKMVGVITSPDVQSFFKTLAPTAMVLGALDSAAVVNAAGVMGDPNSRTRNLAQEQMGDKLNPKTGQTAQSAVALGAEALAKQAKEAAAAAAKADAALAKAQAAHEKRNAEEDAIDRLREQFKKDEQKELIERIKQADKIREDIRERTKTLKDNLRTPAEELAKDLKELMELRAAGLDNATFGKGLADLQSKARDLSGQANLQPQTIGAVRAGSIEALRAQFNGRNVSEKQLEEQRKAVAEAATANGLLGEIKVLLAANQLKEAL